LLQYDHTTITGDLLEQIRSDPDAKHNRRLAVQYAQNDPRYGIEDFSISGENTVHLGGGLGAWEDPENIPSKLEAYSNLPTLAMRNADFNYNVHASKDKQIQATLTINDTLDLTDENPNRWWGYKIAIKGFGFLYHTVLGGNAKMTTSASWTWSK
jgi:hypothetical protein